MTSTGIYLDHAATSWPKPPSVLAAVQRWYLEVGVSEGRGDGQATRVASTEVASVRRELGRLCGVPASQVAFVSGATEGLNLALRALLPTGSTVLTTAFEHSSVVRPLRALARERRLHLVVLPPAADGGLTGEQVTAALAEHRPHLFVFTHASNVTGAVFDAAAFAASARSHGCTSLLDASQSAGWLPIDVGADVVVASAHKALLGPPGLGFVAVRDPAALRPQKQGGTGSSTALDEHPESWPTAFEAGTPNTPAIFGLAAALRWAAEQPAAPRLAAALAATDQLAAALQAVPGTRLCAPPPGPRLPVLSFVPANADPRELGLVLGGMGWQVRSGHHCAPWLHRHLGTSAHGTVRLSPGGALPPGTAEQLAEILRGL